jgi:hypothetical protein
VLRVSDGRSTFPGMHLLSVAVVTAMLSFRVAVSDAAQANSSAIDSDSQAWSEVDLTVPVTQEFSLRAESLARVSTRAGDWVTFASGLYAAVAVDTNLTLAPFYGEYDTYKELKRNWLRTGEPGLDVTLTSSSEPCQFSDRSRWYYVLGEATSRWVYRNRPGIECELGPRRWELTAHISDELFHYASLGAVTRQRWIAGARTAIGRNLSVDLYYLRQNDRIQLPSRVNALGVTIEVRLRE